MSEDRKLNEYEFRLRLFGNEVFNIGFSTTGDSNRWAVVSLVTVFAFMAGLAFFGKQLIALFGG